MQNENKISNCVYEIPAVEMTVKYSPSRSAGNPSSSHGKAQKNIIVPEKAC